MKIHIVGAGPTGLSLAWEILQTGKHDVVIYDRKLSVGGSWWEPDMTTRDLHAHRIVFDRAFVNTKSFFEEMNIKWDEIFEPETDDGASKYIFKKLHIQDYKILSCIIAKVYWNPKKYKKCFHQRCSRR